MNESTANVATETGQWTESMFVITFIYRHITIGLQVDLIIMCWVLHFYNQTIWFSDLRRSEKYVEPLW
jgi:hypothetical protein